MLNKKQRLHTSGFNEIFAVGKRLHVPCLQIIFVKSTDFHCSVVAGKKVHKTAVARNRLRRQVYSAIYRFTQSTPLPFSLIVVAKPAIKTLTQKEISPMVQAAVAELVAR